MKNVIKAVKKLKLWSRKKRKKKTHEPYYPPPPCQCHYCYSCSSSTQPSAPPLPSWLEPEHNYGTFLAPTAQPQPISEVSYQSQAQALPQEIVMDSSPVPVFPTLPVSISSSSSSSYQQYMVSQPVYGMPVIQPTTRERSTGQFGCVFSFGAHLFRCLCPCFHIREVV